MSCAIRPACSAFKISGYVLDVGCGGGADSMPLVSKAGSVTGVDASAYMLAAFTGQLQGTGVSVSTLQGTWPEAAVSAPVTDVVVCHHVATTRATRTSLPRQLTDHADVGVVMELTERHPMSRVNDLGLHFHGLRRPERPTASDAVEVLRGFAVQRHDWENPALGWLAQFASREDLTACLRRRPCLPAERDAEIWLQIEDRVVERDGSFSLPPLPVVILWWPGGVR